ncbi:MAG: hypothetical protein R6X32_00770 [Chloroflexota bacterium]
MTVIPFPAFARITMPPVLKTASFTKFVPLAEIMGTSAWERIT